MTKDDLFFLVSAKKELEFTFHGKTYVLNYDTDGDGLPVIVFGRLYEERRYGSFGELMNEAKIENHYFREMLELFGP